MRIGEQIKNYRKTEGLTQEQVANYLGVSTPAVNKWEKGNTYPDISLLPALARLLKIDMNELFSFREELTEKEIDGYSTTIESSEDGFTITITNSHIPFLPDTGGMGTYVFTFIGMIGILAVFYSLRKGRKENEKHV